MITKLVLKNFKVHEDLTVNFTNGIVALRGNNEKGKTSLMQAVAYAWFGSRALPLSLAETVTYDKPEASLRVELHFTFENKDYVIVRSKSGAKLTCGDVMSNGQAEVTRFVESLFGVSADSATKIIIASQNKLRGALENNEAIPLIEKLANISLIDELIGKIQDQLPSGSTKQLAESIAILDAQVEPTINRDELQPPIDFCMSKVQLLEAEAAAVTSAMEGVDITGAKAVVTEAAKNIALSEQITAQLKDLYARKVEPVEPITLDMDDLRKRQTLKLTEATRNRVWFEFNRVKQCTEDFTQLKLQTPANKEQEARLRAELQELKLTAATLRAKKINDQVCGLCGKDLQDVPEVVAKNLEADTELVAISDRVTEIGVELSAVSVLLGMYNDYLTWESGLQKFYQSRSDYLEVDSSVFPLRLKWVGEEGGKEEDTTNYVALLRQEEQKVAQYTKDCGVYSEVCKSINKLEKQRSGLSIDTQAVARAEFDLKVFKELETKLHKFNADRLIALREVTAAEHQLALAERQYETELANYTAAQVTKEKFMQQLTEHENNNALIKKLREARPIIATRLWNIVLGSISSHFSQIRGTPSVVTRDASSFLINGKPAGGVSGSTLDSLGLAIRMALGKTFLPSLNLLMLDEPAAGMDEERETAMLGLLASTSYAQIIVVTHSELADSFATSVVQL